MEQGESISTLKPYELATLASRICPEFCVSDPKEAIAAAERLFCEAKRTIDRAHQEGASPRRGVFAPGYPTEICC